jgi:hypothetical protein
MLPAVYDVLASDGAVTELVGRRIFRHGEAPQGVVLPYLTWYLVSGVPENTFDGPPRIDACAVQVDCWSASDSEVERLAVAVRDSIEAVHHMTGVTVNNRDPETGRCRIGMQFMFWTHRP